jgi:hypothetical protein
VRWTHECKLAAPPANMSRKQLSVVAQLQILSRATTIEAAVHQSLNACSRLATHLSNCAARSPGQTALTQNIEQQHSLQLQKALLRSTAHCARTACVAQNPKSVIWPQCFIK